MKAGLSSRAFADGGSSSSPPITPWKQEMPRLPVKTTAIRHSEDRIAALRPGMQEVAALRKLIADAEAGGDVLLAQRQRFGNTLGMLAALTGILPDDTHLTDIAFRSRVATLSGRSDGAARLIAALASDPAIQNPVFTAPITRSDIATNNVEGFSIRMEFLP